MTVRELYIADLGALRDAAQRMLLEWPVLAARAELPGLRAALDQLYNDTQRQLARLESLLVDLDERPRPGPTDVLTGLLAAWHLRHPQLDGAELRNLCIVSTALAVSWHSFTVYRQTATLAAAVNHVEGMRALPQSVASQHTSLQHLGELRDDIAAQLARSSTAQWPPVLLAVPGERTRDVAQN